MANAKKFADIEKVEELGNEDAVAKANAPARAVIQPPDDLVEVTITKFGEGKVSTGVHIAGEGDIYASRGEKLRVSKAIASRLEVLGVAETD